MRRREFLCSTGALALAGIASAAASEATPPAVSQNPQRATLVQATVYDRVEKNLPKVREAFAQAQADKAGWLLFPEMFLTGYHGNFSQEAAAAAMAEIAELCRKSGLITLVGTGWKEAGKVYNQVRIIDAEGRLAGVYAKKCLCYGEDRWTAPGTTPLVFTMRGLTFGVLICNDLWVTPGFSDGPNPHLTLKQARAGAQVIFHHINSGSDQRYRGYHESNHLVRAAEAKCPIVAVNAFHPVEVNAASGVVGSEFRHVTTLPRNREAIQTVEFTPAHRVS